MSQNNHQNGQRHWDHFLHVRNYVAKHPRPINVTKTYGATGQRFGNDQDGIERFWRNLLAGAASIRFHRPTAGLGLHDKAVTSFRGARKLESQIPLWTLEPANDLLINRKPNHAYLSVNSDRVFALYLPVGGEVRIGLSSTQEPMVVRWIEIATGEWGPEQDILGGGKAHLTSPGSGNWAVAITVQHPARRSSF